MIEQILRLLRRSYRSRANRSSRWTHADSLCTLDHPPNSALGQLGLPLRIECRIVSRFSLNYSSAYLSTCLNEYFSSSSTGMSLIGRYSVGMNVILVQIKSSMNPSPFDSSSSLRLCRSPEASCALVARRQFYLLEEGTSRSDEIASHAWMRRGKSELAAGQLSNGSLRRNWSDCDDSIVLVNCSKSWDMQTRLFLLALLFLKFSLFLSPNENLLSYEHNWAQKMELTTTMLRKPKKGKKMKRTGVWRRLPVRDAPQAMLKWWFSLLYFALLFFS